MKAGSRMQQSVKQVSDQTISSLCGEITTSLNKAWNDVENARNRHTVARVGLAEQNSAVLAKALRACTSNSDMLDTHLMKKELNMCGVTSLRETTDLRFLLRASLLVDSGKPDAPLQAVRTLNDLVMSPVHMSPPELAYNVLRFYVMHPHEWSEKFKDVPHILGSMLSNKMQFLSHWEHVPLQHENLAAVDQEEQEQGYEGSYGNDITTETHVQFRREFPEIGDNVFIFIGNDSLTQTPSMHAHDPNTHDCLVRAHRETMNAAYRMGIAPKRILLSISPKLALCVSMVPTTMHGHLFNLDARVLVLPDNYHNSKQVNYNHPAGTTLCLSCTGISNDQNPLYSPGHCKRVSLQVLKSVSSPGVGPCPKDVVSLAALHLYRAAKEVGRIHMLTQMAKSILKERTVHTPASTKLTAAQKGVHLRDEVKLYNYYQSVTQELNATERAIWDEAVRVMDMNKEPPLSIIYKSGKIDHLCSPIKNAHSQYHMQSTHHVQAIFNIRGKVPIQCKPSGHWSSKTLQVSIDNDWDLECSLLCYS